MQYDSEKKRLYVVNQYEIYSDIYTVEMMFLQKTGVIVKKHPPILSIRLINKNE